MPTYMAPDVYIEEVAGGARPIQAVGTSTAGFVGRAPAAAARLNEAVAINNWSRSRTPSLASSRMAGGVAMW